MQLPTRDRDDHPASGQTLTAGALTRGTTDLRGYRATTVAWTGGLALPGGAAQAAWVSNPADSPGSYLLVWVGVAVAGILTLMLELTSRWNRLPGPRQRAGLLRTLFTLTPAFAAGGLVTLALISRVDGLEHVVPDRVQVAHYFARLRRYGGRAEVDGFDHEDLVCRTNDSTG